MKTLHKRKAWSLPQKLKINNNKRTQYKQNNRNYKRYVNILCRYDKIKKWKYFMEMIINQCF